MKYAIVSAPDCLAVDTSWKLTPAMIAALVGASWNGQPIRGIIRYVSLRSESKQDIDAAELEAIAGAGLGAMLVQHVRYPGWTATYSQGSSDGVQATANALVAEYPMGAQLWLDLEGLANVGQEVIRYANAWSTSVLKCGYVPGLYVGDCCGLTSQQLYDSLPDFHTYWSDWGDRHVDRRGFCVKQHAPTTIAGVAVDPDTIRADLLGGRPMWAVMAKEAA